MPRLSIPLYILSIVFSTVTTAASGPMALTHRDARGDVELRDIMYGGNTSTTLPTWGSNSTKMVVKQIANEDVAFASVLYAGASPFTCGIYRRIGAGGWVGISSFWCHQPPNLVLDGDNRLHAIFPDTDGTVAHLRFDDPVHSAAFVEVDTSPILGGAPTNAYFGLAYDRINHAIWLVFSDTSWRLRAALYTTAWNAAEVLGSYSGHAYLYPCVVATRGEVHVLTGRFLLGSDPHVYDGIVKYTRRGSWSGNTVAEALGATQIALFAGDLVETDVPGEVIGLIYCSQEYGGPRETGAYIVRPESGWRLGDGEHIGGAPDFSTLSNLFVDSRGGTWVVGTYGPTLRYRYRPDDQSPWTYPFLVEIPGTVSAAPVSVKRKSGADWLEDLAFCYSANFDGTRYKTVTEGRAQARWRR